MEEKITNEYLTENPEDNSPLNGNLTHKPHSKRNLIFIILGIVLLIALFSGVFYFLG